MLQRMPRVSSEIRNLGAVVAILAAGLGAYACAGKSGAVSLSEEQLSSLPTAKSTGRFALGINEAIAVPNRKRTDLSDSELKTALEADAAKVREVGATLVRGHTGNFPQSSCSVLAQKPNRIDDMDAWVQALGTDLTGLAMVSPWPGNQTGSYTSTYLPPDMDAYKQCVQSIVERYDGDGTDDMPGLKNPIKYWEIDNEPDLKHTDVARGAKPSYDPSKFALPSEYAQLVKATAKAIRAADAGAIILAGGFYRPHATGTQEYLTELLANESFRDSFDILSLHTYSDDDGEKLAIGIAASRLLLPDKPVWVTETSVSTDGGEDLQARRVAALVAQSAAAGAERLFWHSLADPRATSSEGHYETNSLFRATGDTTAERKPAAEVFRRLAAKLATDDLVGAVPDGEGAVKLKSGAILLYMGERTAKYGGLSLRSGDKIAAGGTAAAPAWLDAN